MQSKYARYKALRAKFKAAQNPVPGQPQVRFGATSNKQMRELERELKFIGDDVGLARGVLRGVIDRTPVKASVVDGLGINLPKGYERQGNQFVFQPESAAAKGTEPTSTAAKSERAIDVPKMQKVIQSLRTGPMVDFTTVAGFKDSDLTSVRQYALKLLTGQNLPMKDATFKRFMSELAAALNVPVTTPGETVKAVDRVLRDIEEGVIEPTSTERVTAKGVETAPAEVKEIFREIDAGKNKRTVRRRVQDDYKDGKKALFVADNIEQIIAEAEATGKVTKVCP